MEGTRNGPGTAAATTAPAAVAELLLAGSDVGHLLERLVRRRADLSLAQFNALRVIGGREPAAAQASDLARALHLSSAHATTLLQQLERRELIAREESTSDRRRRPVRLSAAGRSALDGAMPALAQLEERLAAVVGAERMRTLWGDLRAIRMSVREALATDDLDCVGP